MIDPQPSDATLLSRFRTGDEEAFAHLFSRHADLIAGRLRTRLPTALQRKVSIADLLQEVRLVAYRRFGEIEARSEASVRSWLLTVADNKVKAAIQKFAQTAKRAADRELSRGARPDTAAFVGRGPSPSEVAIGRETQDLARQAVETLPVDYQEVLRLALEEHLSLREVAARMGRSREAVKKLYGRALSRFTEAFERLTGEAHG